MTSIRDHLHRPALTPTREDRHAAACAIECGEPLLRNTIRWVEQGCATGEHHPYDRMAQTIADARREGYEVGFVAGFKDAHVAEGGAG